MISHKNSRRIGFLTILALAGPMTSAWSGEAAALKAAWKVSSTAQTLKSWNISELGQIKTVSNRESDGEAGKTAQWKGVLISKFVEKALLELPPEQRASVDLLVFRNASGKEALIPRSLVTHYPLILAYQKNGKALESADGPLTVVVPLATAPKILQEGLPLQAYGLGGVTEVEFASYQSRYSGLFLKRRTDPAAIRGEKMYVQNCIGCHGAGRARSITEVSVSSTTQVRTIASADHPQGVGAPKLSEREMRALVSYLEAFRNENQSVSLIHPQAGSPAIRKQ